MKAARRYAAALYRPKDGGHTGPVNKVRIVPRELIGGEEWKLMQLEAKNTEQILTWSPIISESQADADRAYREELTT